MGQQTWAHFVDPTYKSCAIAIVAIVAIVLNDRRLNPAQLKCINLEPFLCI
jgi:hypothetical protein